MMTGPVHYATSESLLAIAEDDDLSDAQRARAVAHAQVHATLALVAATYARAAYDKTPTWMDDPWIAAGALPERPSGGAS
jgi:hypothetical protein